MVRDRFICRRPVHIIPWVWDAVPHITAVRVETRHHWWLRGYLAPVELQELQWWRTHRGSYDGIKPHHSDEFNHSDEQTEVLSTNLNPFLLLFHRISWIHHGACIPNSQYYRTVYSKIPTQGSVVSAIGSGIITIISAIANVVMIIIEAITTVCAFQYHDLLILMENTRSSSQL